MRKIILCVTLIIIALGMGGCMSEVGMNRSKYYETAILKYLEEKYAETFVIEELVRRSDIGKRSVVLAKTYSEKYPNEFFDVLYYLPSDDIEHKEEIVDFLKTVDAYDESKLNPNVHNDVGYFEDDYCNIVLQNKFDEEHGISNVLFAKTLFETTNFYPSINGNDLTLAEYIDSLPCSIYACTIVFVDEDTILDDLLVKKITDELSVEKIDRQFIYIHRTDKSLQFIQDEFMKHYDDVVMYFKDAEFVMGYEDIFLAKGEIQNG